jgi:Trm5-related predicted tRNA methylase
MILQNRHRLWCWSSSVHYFHFFRCPEHLFNVQRQLRQAKLLVAARLADYIVIDCSFVNEYNENDISLVNYYERLQLKIHSCFTPLYRYHSPSFVILCNVFSNHNDKWLRNSPFCHATSLSYLDLFPREQLVYLSPDSPNIMTEYEHNVIYILGGIFQKSKLFLQDRL